MKRCDLGEFRFIEKKLKDDSKVHVRHANEEDALRLCEYFNTIVELNDDEILTSSGTNPEDEEQIEWKAKKIFSMESSENDLYVIAESQGEVVGRVEVHTDKRGLTNHVGNIKMSVLPEWFERGVGRVLLYETINWAVRNKVVEKLKFTVMANNENMVHLFSSYGFVEGGRLRKEVKLESGEYVDYLSFELLI